MEDGFESHNCGLTESHAAGGMRRGPRCARPGEWDSRSPIVQIPRLCRFQKPGEAVFKFLRLRFERIFAMNLWAHPLPSTTTPENFPCTGSPSVRPRQGSRIQPLGAVALSCLSAGRMHVPARFQSILRSVGLKSMAKKLSGGENLVERSLDCHDRPTGIDSPAGTTPDSGGLGTDCGHVHGRVLCALRQALI